MTLTFMPAFWDMKERILPTRRKGTKICDAVNNFWRSSLFPASLHFEDFHCADGQEKGYI